MQNGAPLHPRDGGEVVTDEGGGKERGHAGGYEGSLGVVSGELELVYVAIAL